MNIAIVGATGNVGRKLIEILEKRNFESLISQNLFKARIIKKDNNAVSIPLNKNCPSVGKEITQKIEIYRGNNGNRNL